MGIERINKKKETREYQKKGRVEKVESKKEEEWG